MITMKIEEIKDTLQDAGWTIRYRNRRRNNLQYIYAAKRIRGKVRETYIAPKDKVEHLTKEQVLKRLEEFLERA